jgi:sterol desaturase/sphingolipid hydroxylase (fatty acid hydroxylase superfamily)
METYGKILLIAVPAFLFLIIFEKWYGISKGKDTLRNMDMVSSLCSGITNVTKDVIGLFLVVLSYPFFLEHLAITQVPNILLTYVITFFALDFAGYCVHRLQHTVNFFWNGHIIHHSSEDFNLACALRQSVSAIVKVFAIFLLPAALLGVPEQVVATVAPLHLFAQFWYHTQHINKMGWLEKIIVTPSHHRVHHAINDAYIDKNYGQIFIFWDKWFGTFQAEMDEVVPVYGITRPVQTWNPIKINFQHAWLMIKDAWHTRNWADKFLLWLKPTGYRPADVAEKYPVYKIDKVYEYKKYDTKTTPAFNTWTWIQMIMILLFVSYLFGNIAYIKTIQYQYIFWYGGFIFLSVYALTELMDRNKYALIWEILRSGIGIYFLLSQKDWFGANSFWQGASYLLLTYFIISLLITAWFYVKHRKEDKSVLVVG